MCGPTPRLNHSETLGNHYTVKRNLLAHLQLNGNPKRFPLSAIKTKKQYNTFATDLARGVFTVTAVFKRIFQGAEDLPGIQRSGPPMKANLQGSCWKSPKGPGGARLYGDPSRALTHPGFGFLGVQRSINHAFSFFSRLSNGTDVLCVSEESQSTEFGSVALSKLNFDSTYTLVVAASNELGSAFSQPLVFMLIDIGKCTTYLLSVRPSPLERHENILSAFLFKPRRRSVHPV